MNVSRLGISNFWDFNSWDYDRRGFLNNFLIKKLLIYLFSFASIKLNNLFFHNKWFPILKHKIPHKMLYYRQKRAKLHYRDEITYYYIRYRVFWHFSSKIQILQTIKWVCIIWYLYSQNSKQFDFKFYLIKKLNKNKYALNDDLNLEPRTFSHLKWKTRISRILWLKIFLLFKFYNYKNYNTIYTNLFTYNL